MKKKGWVPPASKRTHTIDEWHSTLAVTPHLSGERIHLEAGRDLIGDAPQLVSTYGVSAHVGGEQRLTPAEHTHREQHFKQVKRSGVFHQGVLGRTVGRQTTTTQVELHEITRDGGVIGSSEGPVELTAVGPLDLTGVDLIARDDLSLSGSHLTVAATETEVDHQEHFKLSQVGVTARLKGGVADRLEAVYQHAHRAREVHDPRLEALHALSAGHAAYSGLSDARAAASGEPGISLRVGIGASTRAADTVSHHSQTVSGHLISHGDLHLRSTVGDITIHGSELEGQNITLDSAGHLTLNAHQAQQRQDEHNHGSSGEVGVTLGTEAGIGIYLSASQFTGRGTGEGVSHTESQLRAHDTLTLRSVGDTRLLGAQARGERIEAQIGGDLTLTSLQDHSAYQRKDVSAGADVAVGTGGASVSGHYGQSTISSHWTSVQEQTGLEAGAGGYAIHVAGHTELTGAAIASRARAADNHLETGSLSWSHLSNRAEVDAQSVSVSGGAGSGGGHFGASLAPPQQRTATSTTLARIAEGTLIVHDGSGTDIPRGATALQQDGLQDLLDLTQVQERMELGQLAGAQATELIDGYFDSKVRDAQAPITALEQEQAHWHEAAQAAQRAGDSDARALADAEIDRLGSEINRQRAERDAGWTRSLSKTLAAVGVGALAGAGTDALIDYVGTTGAMAFWGDAAKKGRRAHKETQVIKGNCREEAQMCADLAKGMPDKGTTAERMEYLRANGIDVDYVQEIPKGAKKITVNGILNDAARAAQVAVGNLAKQTPEARNVTFYLQYNASQGWLPDLQQAGYDKFITPFNKDYSATTRGVVEGVKRQGDAYVELHAHSWGTIVTRNALNALAKDKYQNEDMKVAAYGPAVMPGALVEPVKKIVGEERYYWLLNESKKEENKDNPVVPALSFYSNPLDPVSAAVGFNWWPLSPYVYSGSKEYLPGASRSKLIPALLISPMMAKTVNPHSCYGLNCQGSRYNWTEKKAEGHKEFFFYPLQRFIERGMSNDRVKP